MAEGSEESMTKQADIEHLLDHFSRNTYSAKGDVTGMLALNTCLDLFGKDYTYSVINNHGGQLCGHYPNKIVILEYEGSSTGPNIDNRFQPLHDRNKLEDLIRQARLARCRTRFVAPVILYKGKHICRSATLAGWQELFGRKGMDMVLSGGSANGRTPVEDIQSSSQSNCSGGGSQQIFDRHRGKDIELLRELNINYICDLMVEHKKVKCGFYITSSEKVDKENRYRNFSIFCLPYPGCEFFSRWKDSKYDSENVHYDWTRELNTALLDIQDEPLLMSLPVEWERYKHWDLVKLTQNYLQALIRLIDQGSSGVLIHCISGWDRTPLFVTLVRLSLWADQAIHKSLPPSDILYLTLAYDWYLFGHGLPDKLSRGEEILYFCFKMLHYIAGQEFSVNPHSESAAPASSSQHPDCRHHAGTASVERLKHRDSNVSLLSNGSFGSDGAPFHMDTTQDEDSDSVSPLDWDVHPSPQRSRNSSGNSVDEHRGLRHGSRRGSGSVTSHRSGSPLYLQPHRGRSPDVGSATDPAPQRADPPLSSSVVSNHFASSPVNVPAHRQTQPEHPTPSLGSWVEVGMPQMTPPHNITPPKPPGGGQTQASVNSCQEASELNQMSLRKRRLYAVLEIFEEAYAKSVHSKPASSPGALSSLIGNVAEKMGFRSGPR